ncbi:S41 family peptidase [Agaribacter flavus]|uniref:Tricorn protease homolog n=1 Tax=Agaribacter flavus TaxID=1902781 RepID=A0ABV7FWR7_9ALTE
MLKLSALLLCLVCLNAMAAPGYYRYPALHDNTLVFTAEGDLWKVKIGEKYAQRLTTHPAEERESVISPDGSHIAFVANYSGTPEVHVMPIHGGVAKRVTFESVGVKVHAWTSDNKILYSYNGRVGPAGNWTLRMVDPETLVTDTVPLADAVEGTLAQDNSAIYFTQFGLQISSDNAKAYQGGAKGELWKFNLENDKEAKKLTNKHKGSVRSPMLYEDRLFFISNQSGSDNLWSMKLNGKNQTQLTFYEDWQIMAARISGARIVYQLGADIKLFDIASKQSTTIDIQLTSDFPQLRERWISKPLNYLNSAKQAGDHKKVVLTARGRVAIAGTDGSRLVEIATQANSRTRQAILSKDGKSVFALNDSSGEMEIWQYPADGSEEAVQLTSDGSIFRWNLYLSPNGKQIAHDDKNGDLWLLDLETKENKKILSDNFGIYPIASLSWSSDSKLIALTRNKLGAERSQILLIDTTSDTSQVLTSDKYESYSPAFSKDNDWLYFISDRHFDAFPNSPWGDRNMGLTFDRRGQIFAIALKEDAEFPFALPSELDALEEDTSKNDKVEKESTSKDSEDASATETEDSPEKPEVLVDWEGISQRLWQVPVASGNYSKLLANSAYLYVLDRVTEPNSQASLKSIKLAPKSKPAHFLTGVQDFSLSNDGKTLFIQKTGTNKDMFLASAKASFSKGEKETKVLTGGWRLKIEPAKEWQQIFHDAWLMHRDSLYDKDMRGVDWQAVKEKYQPLLTRLTHRNELNDVFKQMLGELSILHSQVRGGDIPRDKDMPSAATLGAEYQQTDKGLKIRRIYSSDPELVSRMVPLAKPGVDAKVGDIISKVNGQPIKHRADLVQALQNQAGKQVLLTLIRGDEQINTIVRPTSTLNDYYSRYYDWTNQNLKKVSAASDNLGYLHIRAMGANDIENFARDFYAQYQKQGLIIDVRRNNGGNIDSWIIEKLLRRAWSFWQLTNGESYTNMQQTFRGHLVVLADQYTYSDGETFTAGIKALDLGTVIGKQTAGAGVWLTGRNRQSDGGMARVAEFPVFAMDGRWITEGRGISPDIEVDNLPHQTFNGEDAQLAEAIKLLKQKIKKNPVKPTKAEAFPKGLVPADDIVK